MKCPKCQTENPDDSKFCKECATPFPGVEGAIPTKTIETPQEELTTGSVFADRYQVIEELGKGGMGKVYRVLDKKLNEEVALKLIKPEIASDKKTLERFNNELKFARKITHKNVGRMYELMEEKGTHFITMEYVPGQDLRGLIRQTGQLTTGKAISIAKQLCEGLSEAHSIGIIHRDLKPSNIMIDKTGNARIMDFGIARSVEAKKITGAGVIIGTPEYMSPEQVEGKETDQRSDIYSLGVILYEMLTGRLPFEGDTPLSIAVQHRSDTPKDPRALNAQISEDLSTVILKCLEKEKGARYQTAKELLSSLAQIEQGIPTTERTAPRTKPVTSREITIKFTMKRLLIPGLAIIVLAAIGFFIWNPWATKDTPVVGSERISIAALPFEDQSPNKDQGMFCGGVADYISTKLTKLKQPWRIVNWPSAMRYQNTLSNIREISQELNVTHLIQGIVRKEGEDIQVTAILTDAGDSTIIWQHLYERKYEDILDIQSGIAEEIAIALKADLSPEEKSELEKRPTENLEANNLYQTGRFFWNKRTEDDLMKAIEYFELAIEKDPNYALAYAGIADSYAILPSYSPIQSKEAFSKGKRAALKALEVDDTVAEAHSSLAYITQITEYDLETAEREYKRAIDLNPNYATAHHWYSIFLSRRGRHDESYVEIKIAEKCDPFSRIINANLGFLLAWARKYDQAIEQLRKSLEMFPDFVLLRRYLGWTFVWKGMFAEAEAEFQKSVDMPGYESALGYVYAVSGRREEAIKLLDKLEEQSKRMYVSPYGLAEIYAALGERNQALEYLERAYTVRAVEMLQLNINPNWDSIRSDPRFKELLKKVGLE